MNKVDKRIAAVWIAGIIGIAAVLIAYTLPGLSSSESITERTLKGRKYAELLSPAVAGRLPNTGTPYLVNFWATWCTPCRAEHGELLSMAQSGIAIVGINSDGFQKRGEVRQWLKELGDPFAAHIFDDDGNIAIQSGLRGYPTSFVIDGEGRIAYVVEGAITAAIREEYLDRFFNDDSEI